MRYWQLALYNQDFDEIPTPPWVDFRNAVEACDALLFITPKYNRSLPVVLKNATDIGSRPPGKNVFAGKPGTIASVCAIRRAGWRRTMRCVRPASISTSR